MNNTVYFGFYASPFGQCLIVFEDEKLHFLAFIDNLENAEENLRHHFTGEGVMENATAADALCSKIFSDTDNADNLMLSISATDFQKFVWDALLAIPRGETRTYQQIADAIGKPRAVRAVANAVGDNPVSYCIPCHRVIRTDGGIGGYRWGVDIKRNILAAEGVKI